MSTEIPRRPVLLVALGGNALIRKGQRGTIEEQFANLRIPIGQIAQLTREYRIIITHGNGPQVGNLLLQQECTGEVPRMPLEILVAQTQGQIGYMIESTLDSELMRRGIAVNKPLVSLISYVVVDENSPAFENPTKPIGPVFTEERAGKLPYATRKTERGYRRVVASPEPLTIVEKNEIMRLIEMDFVVVCCGGGGIPVVREGRSFAGVDAVIDKDLASARLACEVGVEIFVIATDVSGVAVGYGTPGQRFLDALTIEQATKYMERGEFPEGSMLPKIRAAVDFLEAGGSRAFITSIETIEDAVAGRSGTEILRGSPRP
ncbi:MAG TPA: carbamate kinase [Flavobacteriales bacterium]|jgi:carbamate kinase|nr:carbamate kinase [Deltaproteobacteria bacterium]OQC23614.1 MAG: Carbamate kinase 1 [Deltaproteobacteria bacterium ADurb.Bin072]HOP44820.1 carbamate kinase [Flavobacteriales bacterium]HNQ85594.1 carbamate kinase [Deltaproteobacteria bacterium]HNS89830.1 carbamate kinase [Deltaproteobacteria bacterium]